MHERTADIFSLKDAFLRVKANKGCAGIDRVSIAQYERNLGQNLAELSRLLTSGRYEPKPSRRALIPKPNGRKRPLGIPAVRDRVVQQALRTELEPYLEPLFADSSFGFRPGRSALDAVHKVQYWLDEGYEYVVDADIKDFFGTLDHRTLMNKLRAHIPDRDATYLAWQFLKAGVMEEGRVCTATAGTPQGGGISPILANLYLSDFDHSIERTDWKLVRYADDYVVLCKNANAAIQAMRTVRAMMGRCNLELAEEKTRVTDWRGGFVFLGYHFKKYRNASRWPSIKAVKAFKEKIRHLTRRMQPRNVVMLVPKLNAVIRGWGNYFRHGNCKSRFLDLDSWLRMRLRSFIEKRKRSTLVNRVFPNAYFEQMGLVRLASLFALPAYSPCKQLPFAAMAQPYRRAGCGKSARPVR